MKGGMLMNSLLIDNWTMQEIASNLTDLPDTKISEAYADLLTALVLWDEIYYPNNELSQYWKNTGLGEQLSNFIKPYEDKNQMFLERARELYKEYYLDKGTEIVVSGAIRYLMLSNSLNCDYLAYKSRAQFINTYNPIKEMSYNINRKEYTNFLDKNIIDKFKELNEILGRNVFEFEMPVLVDYIIQNTPDDMSYIQHALKLRKEKSVIKYRKFMTEMEKELKNCNWKKIFEFQEASRDLVNDITKIDKKHIINVSMSISVTPSLNISKDFVIKNKKINLTFFKKLIKFAFMGRTMKKK